MPSAPTPELDVKGLQAIVGVDHVLVDADLRAGYEQDWTGRFRGEATAVVRPGSVDEVAELLAWCNDRSVSVVPQGGNTGLVGGGVPAGGELVVSLRRLTALGPVDAAAGQITAGAGVTLADLQRAAAVSGWAFAVDLGARDTATVGGMVATNAGGLHVVRWGSMRTQVVGLEAVLADGRIMRHLAGLVKDNTGYDLAGLLTGSEGTLAVVTAARLRLVPPVTDALTVLVACDGAPDAVELAGAVRRTLVGVIAIEAIWAPTLRLTATTLGLELPVDLPPGGVAVLVEVEGSSGGVDGLVGLADLVGERPAVVASDPAQQRRLWALRERVTEALGLHGVPHKLDVTLPHGALASFAEEVVGRLLGWDVHLFGHLGDGNLHVNVLGPGAGDDAVDDVVFRLVAAYGGSISAEHGIGRAKRRWLGLSRSTVELAVFRAVKNALDPRGILNPGVLLPEASDPGGVPDSRIEREQRIDLG